MGGTVECALHAFDSGVALNIAGGTHHAYRDRGEGFCLLNDFALAAAALLDEGRIERALIVDLDVHQGNGTAKIFEDDPRVFTFSMHGAGNYPMHKESSDLDVGLTDGIDDRHYLKLLDAHWPRLLDEVEPDMVFYQCGVDILETDKLGRLGVSSEGCAARETGAFSSAAMWMRCRWCAAWAAGIPPISGTSWRLIATPSASRTSCGAEALGIVLNWSVRIRPCRN